MRFRFRIEYALLLGVAFLFRWLPMALSRGLGSAVGSLAGKALKIRQKVAVENLQSAFPELTVLQATELYRRVWQHFGKVAAELSREPRMQRGDFEKLIDDHGLEIVKDILRRGKGAIFVSGHLGNWEWLGAMAASTGIPVTFVVENQSNQLVEKWIDRMRAREGVEIYSRLQAPRGTLQALKNNRMVAMLCDQDAGPPGVFVPFFSRMASTPRGPALFHLKTDAPLIYGSCCRENGKFQLRFEEIVPPPSSGDRSEDERNIMGMITERLEQDIRLHPDQYMWLHRRWKTPFKEASERVSG
jgi:KDO2-lipid IV(A) lauroyltransferase